MKGGEAGEGAEAQCRTQEHACPRLRPPPPGRLFGSP